MMPAMRHFRQLLLLLLLFGGQAHATESAKTIFGVELGARFLIPPCTRGEDTMTRRHCYVEHQVDRTPWGTEEHRVFYPRPEVAPYARGEMLVETIGGFIEAIHVNTWGIQGQGTALEALTRSYGPPTRQHSEKVKAQRSRQAAQFAEWDMRDFSVKLDGITSTIDWGRITLATQRYQKLVKAHAAAR